MKYLVLLVTLLLPISGAALAQVNDQVPAFLQAQKPVLCAPLETILETVKAAKEEPYAWWSMPGSVPGMQTTVVMYVDSNDGGVSIIESFETGIGCVISFGADLEIFDNPPKKGIDFTPAMWYK